MKILKNVNFFFGLVRRKIAGSRGPLSVILSITNRCNSQCQHCYASYFSRDNSGEMSTEQVKKLISDLHSKGCRRISFAGGEPLLRKDIGELIEHVNSLGMSSTLNSNGMLVPQCIEPLKNLDALAISLDGRPEHHDFFRGKGSAEKAIEGIKKAVEAGIRVHTNTVLHKHNLDDIDYMLDMARRYNYRAEFNLVITNIFGNGISQEEIKPSNDELKGALKYIVKRKNEGAPILFSVAAYESVLNCWDDFGIEGSEVAPPGMPECPAAKFFCLIDADGTLWACPHLIGKIESKSALEVGVEEAWRVAGSHSCKGCYQVYHHEFSRLMNLEHRVLWNYFKTAIGRN